MGFLQHRLGPERRRWRRWEPWFDLPPHLRRSVGHRRIRARLNREAQPGNQIAVAQQAFSSSFDGLPSLTWDVGVEAVDCRLLPAQVALDIVEDAVEGLLDLTLFGIADGQSEHDVVAVDGSSRRRGIVSRGPDEEHVLLAIERDRERDQRCRYADLAAVVVYLDEGFLGLIEQCLTAVQDRHLDSKLFREIGDQVVDWVLSSRSASMPWISAFMLRCCASMMPWMSALKNSTSL